jgi:hypothetical protein
MGAIEHHPRIVLDRQECQNYCRIEVAKSLLFGLNLKTNLPNVQNL